MHSSGPCIDTACDASIRDEVQFVADQQHRRCLGGAFSELPCHMTVADIALPVGPNSDYLGIVKCRADEKQSISEHRTRDNGITFSIADLPQFMTVLWVVSIQGPTARGNDLAA